MNLFVPKFGGPGGSPAGWSVLFLGAALVAAQADPGVITASLKEPRGQVRVGAHIEIVVEINGYSDQTEIDGFNLKVAYDPRLFAYVENSFNLGANTGPDQQWLTKANQQADTSRITPFVDASEPGVLTVSVVDLLLEPLPAGTTAESGFLFSFQLEGIAQGTGEIMPAPFPDGSVLFEPGLSPTGMPAFAGETKLKVKRGR